MPPRRPASPVAIVVLAAVGALLAGVAGTVSYLGVANYLQHEATGNGSGTDPGGTDPTTTGSASPQASESERPCPQFTIDAVKAAGGPGDLVELVYVRGTRTNRVDGEGWICRDSDGTLYYQGHDIDGQEWRLNVNTIIIGGVIRGEVTRDGSTYVAQASGTAEYHVGPDLFSIMDNAGQRPFTIVEQRVA